MGRRPFWFLSGKKIKKEGRNYYDHLTTLNNSQGFSKKQGRSENKETKTTDAWDLENWVEKVLQWELYLLGADSCLEQPTRMPAAFQVLPRLLLPNASLPSKQMGNRGCKAQSQDANLDGCSIAVLPLCDQGRRRWSQGLSPAHHDAQALISPPLFIWSWQWVHTGAGGGRGDRGRAREHQGPTVPPIPSAPPYLTSLPSNFPLPQHCSHIPARILNLTSS